MENYWCISFIFIQALPIGFNHDQAFFFLHFILILFYIVLFFISFIINVVELLETKDFLLNLLNILYLWDLFLKWLLLWVCFFVFFCLLWATQSTCLLWYFFNNLLSDLNQLTHPIIVTQTIHFQFTSIRIQTQFMSNISEYTCIFGTQCLHNFICLWIMYSNKYV